MDNQVPSMPLGPYDPITHQEVCVWGGRGGGLMCTKTSEEWMDMKMIWEAGELKEVCFGMSFGKLLLLSKLRV